jgi:hypothetical protein
MTDLKNSDCVSRGTACDVIAGVIERGGRLIRSKEKDAQNLAVRAIIYAAIALGATGIATWATGALAGAGVLALHGAAGIVAETIIHQVAEKAVGGVVEDVVGNVSRVAHVGDDKDPGSRDVTGISYADAYLLAEKM